MCWGHRQQLRCRMGMCVMCVVAPCWLWLCLGAHLVHRPGVHLVHVAHLFHVAQGIADGRGEVHLNIAWGEEEEGGGGLRG